MEVIDQPKSELSLQQRAAVALGSSELEESLIALAKKHADIVAVKDKTDRAQVHGAAMTLKNNRTAIKSTGKAAREDATAFQKAVIAEENRLVAIIEPEEIRLFSLRDEFDAAEEAERQAKIAAELARTDGIKAKINDIRNIPLSCVGKSSVDISQQIFLLAATPDYSDMAEFEGEAKAVRLQVLEQLAKAETAARNAEMEAESRRQEAARIAAEREELAKLRKEQEAKAEADRKALEAERAALAKQRAEAEAAAAELRKADEEKLAAQRAELEAQQAAINAQREAQEAAAAAEQAKRDAEAKAVAEAEAKRLQEASDEAERQERVAKQERERIACQENIERVHGEITETLVANGFHPSDAITLISLIHDGKLPHVTITY